METRENTPEGGKKPLARSPLGKMRKNSAKRGETKNRAANTSLAFYPEWMDLQGLTQYAAVSDRTLRDWIHSDVDPFPAVRRGGKFLVNRRAFDAWLLVHTVKPANSLKQIGSTVNVTAGHV